MACFLALCAGLIITVVTRFIRKGLADRKAGDQVLHDRIAPFYWIFHSPNNGRWHMVPISQKEWERKAGVSAWQSKSWIDDRHIIWLMGLLLIGQLATYPQDAGWILLMNLIPISLWCSDLFRQASAQRKEAINQVGVRPWQAEWRANHPREWMPTEGLPSDFHFQAQVVRDHLSNPEKGDPAMALQSIRKAHSPRIAEEALRMAIYQIAHSGIECEAPLRLAIQIGAPVDQHLHERQTSLFYEKIPLLTAFVGQHQGSGEKDFVSFFIDALPGVIAALKTHPEFDINAKDPLNDQTVLSEILLAADHYLRGKTNLSKGAYDDLFRAIEVMISEGADIGLAIDPIVANSKLDEERVRNVCAGSPNSIIQEHMAYRDMDNLKRYTPPAPIIVKRSGRL